MANRFDSLDIFVVLGFILLEAGVGAIYIPAALILAGILMFAFALLGVVIRTMKVNK
jgi:hypothetical protein